MQFVRGGPDVPERLLQSHEDGRVVFFCGAGIFNLAGLSGFPGLADDLYSCLEITPNAVQAATIKAKRYDTAVGLLEGNIVGERRAVRHVNLQGTNALPRTGRGTSLGRLMTRARFYRSALLLPGGTE